MDYRYHDSRVQERMMRVGAETKTSDPDIIYQIAVKTLKHDDNHRAKSRSPSPLTEYDLLRVFQYQTAHGANPLMFLSEHPVTKMVTIMQTSCITDLLPTHDKYYDDVAMFPKLVKRMAQHVANI
jgi:hypothetical protein